jgi:hypothetical protein
MTLEMVHGLTTRGLSKGDCPVWLRFSRRFHHALSRSWRREAGPEAGFAGREGSPARGESAGEGRR